ncbi:MAG: OmpA family protein [Candidatus Cloacimonetes bacterium]|nr:OmpA family protein [Candidatus Cloacimonadota bacterium]
MKLIKIIPILLLIIFISNCVKVKNIAPKEKGLEYKRVLIKTEPTKARLFLNGEYLGKSPLKTDIWFAKERKINIKAEPIYPNQFPQNIYLTIPPIPKKMTIYMDHQPKSKTNIELEEKAEIKTQLAKTDTVILEKMIIHEIPFVLPTIYFMLDQHKLKESELCKLNALITQLQNHPELIITVNGFADEQGTPDHNMELSMNRAQTVSNYLIEQGIDNSRIETFARGEQTIINKEGIKLEFEHTRIVEFQLSTLKEE